jgi:hypothetical protein
MFEWRRTAFRLFMVATTAATIGAAVAAPGAAQADVTSAARSATLALPRAAALVSNPTTSPGVENFSYNGFSPVCPTGYACAIVFLDGASSWRQYFQFYNYGYYNLSGWRDWGYAINRQTGGAAMRLYNGNTQVQCIAPGNQPLVDWYPITRIRLTASAC